MFTRESSIQLSTRKEFGIFARRLMVDHQACVNTVFVHKLKQEGIEIALLVLIG